MKIVKILKTRIKRREQDASLDATQSNTDTIKHTPSPSTSRAVSPAPARTSPSKNRYTKKNKAGHLKQSKSFHVAPGPSPSISFTASFDDSDGTSIKTSNIRRAQSFHDKKRLERGFLGQSFGSESDTESVKTNKSDLSDLNRF
ncbi:uncharacterized protein LOC134825718, partial [Bolinopsis microptera]|uniref:uncharacterized protein LOC134825718 n=1 Tax=Bolinopsis microptera TaxID=2820187 RepID=UPI00307ACCEF